MNDLAGGTARRRVPLLVWLAGILSASMYVPAIHAVLRDAHFEGRVFFYWGTILLFLTGAVAIASARERSSNVTRSHLVALLGALTLLPGMAAIPLWEVLANTRPVNAYVEMVAAITTTGGTLFAPTRLSETLHLWRAVVGWQGGLLMLVAAVAILDPLRLGGFEVTEATAIRRGASVTTRIQTPDPEIRLLRSLRVIGPIYAVLTGALWAFLVAAGETPTRAVIHAMSTLSTSGITARTGMVDNGAGIIGEMAVFAFLLFAVTRIAFTEERWRDRLTRLPDNRELRIAAAIVGSVSVLLLLRHWVFALDVQAETDALGALRALWGTAFTVLSFLTTTGWESTDWATARTWSGLDTPIVLLLGLALFGGGVATTAGGVKLLRIYALYEHGRREIHLLVHPHGIAGGAGARTRLPMRGVEAAWVFFMLFALGIGAVTLALSITGVSFTNAMILAISALTTTGPLADIALGTGPATGIGTLSDAAKIIWAGAMVLGRLETLALIALFNPDFWRK
ncbi:potassium transporter TrkH [Jannaschia pagri]|uniref:Potassium transporter TrkH n=1 Tax=Jannaschia pagri TaxID=2829797 RepID=A0ABQ4NPA7_9RHOB|nr:MULTISPECIES: potassium transporter TrkG [unclassified Jannaschia]GIT92087.1 potassium transporter TrkH [Jannaschia sp. AI_61]GIT95922.1 potassium transporter TrkH [Jannaschia sp. AI_62]